MNKESLSEINALAHKRSKSAKKSPAIGTLSTEDVNKVARARSLVAKVNKRNPASATAKPKQPTNVHFMKLVRPTTVSN
jgi:hypothetical protein